MNILNTNLKNRNSKDYEKKRLEALHAYNVLDSFAEKDFDDITNVAADLCKAPICLISLVDKDRQWFLGRSPRVRTSGLRSLG